jgi:hypothetical protein
MGKTGDTHTDMLQNASSKEFQWKIGENEKFVENRIYRSAKQLLHTSPLNSTQ